MALLQGAKLFQPDKSDRPVHRLVVKGSEFGASWSGRIDVYAYVDPKTLAVGQILTLAHMEAKAKVWVKRWERSTMNHDGVVSGYRRCLPGDEGAEEREEVTKHVTIMPAPESATPAGILVWAEAYTKTTLKGLGRQFYTHLEGTPLWSLSVTGAARSGRFHTTAMLAVVEEENPLVHVFREGGEETRTPIAD